MDLKQNILLIWVYYIISTYLFISFLEWMIHRYFMHGDANKLKSIPIFGNFFARLSVSHKKHHNDILMNMDYVDLKLTNGFGWNESAIFILLTFIFLKLLTQSKNILLLIGISIGISLLYSFLWNTLHNHMHNTISTIDITQGVPSVIIPQSLSKKSYLYKKLYINHALHHLQKGEIKYNYNIILPFFDYIFFTKKYGTCFDNSYYCEHNEDKRCKTKVKGCI